MKTILGLDLGVASIGWAIINEDEKQQKLILSGVRVLPMDNETVSNFVKGAAYSKNQERRQGRSARRNNHRYKLRKYFLNKFLGENGLLPIDEALFKLSPIALYGLRDKAIREQVSLQELARIWYHLNQKRGYIDSRKGAGEDEKDPKYVENIKNRSKHLYDNYETVGSYFYHKLLENPIYRIKSGNDKENIFLVDDYKREFDLIWNEQAKYYPALLTDTNFDVLRNKIIYYKRKLKSQKHLISECRFEKYHKCMPVSSPIADEIRLWQDINKAMIVDKYNQREELSAEEKVDLFNYLNNNEKITEKEFLKRYSKDRHSKNDKVNFEKQIRGSIFKVRLLNLLKKYNHDESIFEDFDALSENFIEHPLYKIWHLLYATEDVNDIRKTLSEKYFYTDEDLISEILKLPIRNDFAALSSRAARKLIPFLRKGMMYDKACKAAGYNHSNSLTKEQNAERTLVSIPDLQHIKQNALKNPTVEKILNQLINLLKALHQDGYRFDEIRIELARELKKNAKQRKKITEQNRENEKLNAEILEKIKEHIKNPTQRDIEKYKLWIEFDGVSPYEPNNRILLSELFDKAKYEIEHIIPKSRYFDDSLNNRTIARVQINKEKDNATAYDYMISKSPEVFQQYIERVKNTKLSSAKRRYLLMGGKDIPDDFINRQLNETRYITAETLKLLKSICREVVSTSGSVTDYLRHHWGYDNVLMNLNFERVSPQEIEIKEINGQLRKVIKNWTKRNDHRHHAVDAIVIACTKRSYIQQLNTLNATYDQAEDLKSLAIKHRVPFSFEEVKENVANILVSYKAGKKVGTKKKIGKDRWHKTPGNFGQVMIVPRGQLHEESVYGEVKRYAGPVDISKLKNVDECAVGWQKNAIIKHIGKYDNDLAKALKNIKKDPVIFEGNKVLNEVVVFVRGNVKKYDLQYSTLNKFDKKAAAFIVNENVKKIVLARLNEFDNDPAKAFKNLNERSDKNPDGNPLYFNREKNIVIKSVRCFTGGSDYPALHVSEKGKTLNEKQSRAFNNAVPVDFVKGGSNHHIAIYRKENGEVVEVCVTFFEAFNRMVNEQEVIQKDHPLGYKFVASLQRNEMFVFGVEPSELEQLIDQNELDKISKHLFKVVDIAPGQYRLLHHLDTKLGDNNFKSYLRNMNRFIQKSASSFSGIKVRVTNTNKIFICND